MLYSKKDKGLQSFFIQNSEADKDIKSLKWRNLDALVAYAEGGECRHAEILTYYRDSQRLKKCGHCDSCAPSSDRKILDVLIPKIKTTELKLAKVKKHKFIVNDEMTPDQQILFKSLKAWRKIKADELDMPAFVIFGDKTLRELAQRKPTTLEELMQVYGLGESKIEKFGTELLREIGNV